ncbi:uncharacterized protein [Montipora foliosa]|uniref:uncharacterized protein n=1 Tax=Montipora foliosa TaxID=591990 RepID=UPI0035F1072B
MARSGHHWGKNIDWEKILCFVAMLISFALGKVIIEPVPTPPPGGGQTNTGNTSQITPERDEVQINQALGANGTNLILGDIISDVETERFIKQDPRGRNAIKYPHGFWPQNTVPYIIDETIEGKGIQAIKDAIMDYHSFTCLKFVPRTTQKNYIRFTVGGGCSSFIGRTARGEQKVNLHQYCWYKGIVIHELAHAIGFFHEQSRSDRDTYVRILYENIEQGKEDNFDKFSAEEIQHLGEPYDYGSIMHYGSKTFSKNGQPTILALKKGGEEKIGQRNDLSDNDIRQINKLYKCPQLPVSRPDSRPVVYCSFDSNTLCEFEQDSTDNFDWTLHKGSTPSGGTGPTTDMSGRGWYIYAETSSPRVPGDRAVLLSPYLSGPYCLRLHFHMLGTDIDSLNAYKNSGSQKTVIFSTSGNKGDQWYTAQTSLTGTEQFRIELEAVRGKSYRGDVALDEIKLTPGNCDDASSTDVTPTPTESKQTPVRPDTTPTSTSRREVYCNFDAQSLCEFTQGKGDQFDWTLNEGATSSAPDTGPTNGVFSKGYYIYAEASVPRKSGDVARLESPKLAGSYCIQFYYHMYGAAVGQLQVFALAGAQNVKLVTYNGNQGNTWHSVQAFLRASQNYQYQVIFEAQRGQGWAGDIALDEIRLTPGDCNQFVVATTLPPPTTNPTTLAATQMECNFDSRSWCSFTQDTSDDFNWSLHTGRTASYPTTGPTTDFSGRGYYIYAEASSPRREGEKARLLSPFVTGTTCVLFRYHMNGEEMGSLNLYGKIGSQETQLWSVSGHQGNTWNGLQFRVTTTARFQVVFEAVRGRGYQSDIALDEIKLFPGACVAANPPATSTSIPKATTARGPSTKSKEPTCPSGWAKHGQSCYKGYNHKSLWRNAKARCQEHGGHLVTINDAMEQNFVKNMAALLRGDYRIWIGLRRNSNGRFTHWDNGEELSFTRWIPGEPNNFFNDEDCAEMLRYDGRWLDRTCEGPFAGEHPFICEISGQSNTRPLTQGLHCPSGWNKLDDACYRVYGNIYSMSWSQANSVCNASRATLVSILSQSEHNAVWELMTAHTRRNYGFWIGLKRSSTKAFAWKDGSSLTYTQWSKGRPSSRGLGEDCAFMKSRTGKWFNGRCRHQLPFICKISPKKIISTGSPSTSTTFPCGIKKVKDPSSAGGSLLGQIVGGKISTPGAWPWQVAIMCKTCKEQDCGGTLVSAQHVITAAHCLSINKDTFIENYKVRLGEHHFENSEGYEQDINISSVTIHPSYGEAASFDGDLAVIELASPARINDHVGPVCLQNRSSDFPPGSRCYITGWGRTRQGGSISAVLREAEVPLVSNQNCRENYGSGSIITSNMLCAGRLGAGVDACQGDSGGPLVCEKDNRWYLVGTTSWGWGCAGKYYGVYTNIARLSDWIQANVQ